VRVWARRLHDGRGVGRRSWQEGKSRHRSPNGADHAAPTSPSRGQRPKTCPVLRRSVGRLVRRRAEETPEGLWVDAVVRARIGTFPAAASRPAPERRC